MKKEVTILLFTILLGFDVQAQASFNNEPTGFVLIKPGQFQMGSIEGDIDEKPIHKVLITKPFYILDHEITVEEYSKFIENSSYRSPDYCTDGISNWKKIDKNSFPVNCVSWSDAVAYIQWLNAQQDKNHYRLPTEAEWEYAAKAGTNMEYSCGESKSCLNSYAWFLTNSNYDSHPVKRKLPNPWKLYDMHGNVAEWVSDMYGKYSDNAESDPRGPMVVYKRSYDTLYHRVYRGGKWMAFESAQRASKRYHDVLNYHSNFVGFRIVKNY